MANLKITMNHLSEELKMYLSNLASPSGGASYINDMLDPVKRNVQLNTDDLREAEGRIAANEANIASIQTTMSALNTEALAQQLETITTNYNSLFDDGKDTISMSKMDPSIRNAMDKITDIEGTVEALNTAMIDNNGSLLSSISSINSTIDGLSDELAQHKTEAHTTFSALDERIQTLEEWQLAQQNEDGMIPLSKLDPEVRTLLRKTNRIDTLESDLTSLSRVVNDFAELKSRGIKGDFLSIINNNFATKSIVNRICVANTEREFADLKEAKWNKIYNSLNKKLYIGSDVAPENVDTEAMTEEELAEWNRQQEAGFYYTVSEDGLLDERYNYSFIWDENNMCLHFNEDGVLSILPVNTSANDSLNMEEIQLLAGESRDIEIEDPIRKQVKVFVLDDDSESDTYQKWINAEGVCTLAYGPAILTVRNDSEVTLTLRVVY